LQTPPRNPAGSLAADALGACSEGLDDAELVVHVKDLCGPSVGHHSRVRAWGRPLRRIPATMTLPASGLHLEIIEADRDPAISVRITAADDDEPVPEAAKPPQ
jgi:hypothetical protein